MLQIFREIRILMMNIPTKIKLSNISIDSITFYQTVDYHFMEILESCK
jgi:hypothetical protein